MVVSVLLLNAHSFYSLVQPFEDIKADVNRMLAVPIHTLHRSWSYQVNEECICTAAKVGLNDC